MIAPNEGKIIDQWSTLIEQGPGAGDGPFSGVAVPDLYASTDPSPTASKPLNGEPCGKQFLR